MYAYLRVFLCLSVQLKGVNILKMNRVSKYKGPRKLFVPGSSNNVDYYTPTAKADSVVLELSWVDSCKYIYICDASARA